MQGDEAIAVPATPPVAPLKPALAGRRPSSSRRGRFASFMADVRAEAGQFRRLFRYSRPYRVMLVASWIGRPPSQCSESPAVRDIVRLRKGPPTCRPPRI